MLVLLLANMITLPVAISFFNDDLSPPWIIFNGVCDTVFLTDLIINFRTGRRFYFVIATSDKSLEEEVIGCLQSVCLFVCLWAEQLKHIRACTDLEGFFFGTRKSRVAFGNDPSDRSVFGIRISPEIYISRDHMVELGFFSSNFMTFGTLRE